MAYTTSQKKNLLIALLLALIAFLLLINQDEEQPSKPLFSAIERRNVESIIIDFKGETKQFTKQGNTWLLTSPFERRANASRINILLATLSLPKHNIYNVASAKLDELGLNPAQATLTLDEGRFDFGKTDTKGKQRYLRHNDQFTLIPDLVYPLFSSPAKEFLELELAPPGLIGIKTARWSIKKDLDQEQWLSDHFSNEKAEAIASAWLRQDADDIVAWPTNNHGTITSSTPESITLIASETHKIELSVYTLPDLAIIHPQQSNYALIISLEKYSSLELAE